MNQAKNWKNKIIYQIFPRSFKDTTNDGNGDLKGIIEKITYIKSLNVDIIWLCPIYDTEFTDAGYDVLDYFNVWKQFGTIEDFKKLVATAKEQNIEIMMDIVLNHTSNKNLWFLKALESEKNIEHQFYIWSKKPGKEKSIFGGSSWKYVKKFNKSYYHLFTENQVDLNWENQATINNFAKIIEFWYKLGVKCFRLDAIQHVAKDFGKNFSHSFASKMVNILQKFNKAAFYHKSDIYCFGEASGISPQKLLKYGSGKEKICQNFYNFSWWWIGWSKITGRNGVDYNWSIAEFANPDAKEYQKNLKIKAEMLTNFLTNHDTARAISRWGHEGVYWKQAGKSLCLLLFSLKGIPSIYFGEEIGMLNNQFYNREEFRDIDVFNSFKIFVDQQKLYSENEMLLAHNINSRDHSRYPMQWDNSKNFGFSNAEKTWIKLGKNPDQKISVLSQENDPNSILNFYRNVISLRKSKKYNNLFLNGTSKLEFYQNLLIITRKLLKQKIIVIVNLNQKEIKFNKKIKTLKMLFNSYYDKKKFNQILRPFESVMLLIKN